MPTDHNMFKKRWNYSPNPNLTDPKKGSPHTKAAVDPTLTKNDTELDMGTDFDDFTEKAFHLLRILLLSQEEQKFTLSYDLSRFDFHQNLFMALSTFDSKNIP